MGLGNDYWTVWADVENNDMTPGPVLEKGMLSFAVITSVGLLDHCLPFFIFCICQVSVSQLL